MMNRKTRIGVKLAAVLIVATGCAQQAQKDLASCELSATSSVDRLFAEVSERLAHEHCHYHFDRYQERLLAAAKGAPGAENEARFAGLLRQSIDRGIISRRQGQALFSRHFDPEFYTVKAEPRSNCSSLRQKDRIYIAMREELDYKREGMLDVLDDEERFRRAQRHFSDLKLVFDAVDLACTQAL